MVCSFLTSLEYQNRFSAAVTHTNAECPQGVVCSATPTPTPTPITQLSMSGEPGDYIGQTTNYFYTASTGRFGASAADYSGDGIVDDVQVSYLDNNHNWYF